MRDFSKVKSNLALLRLLLFDLADLEEEELARLVKKSSKSFQTGLLLSFGGLFFGTFSFKTASATRASIEAAGRSSNFGLNKAEVINLIKLAEKHVCCSMEVTKASLRLLSFTMASKALTVASSIGLDGVLLPIKKGGKYGKFKLVKHFVRSHKNNPVNTAYYYVVITEETMHIIYPTSTVVIIYLEQ